MKAKQVAQKQMEFTVTNRLIDPFKRLIDLTWGEVVEELEVRFGRQDCSLSSAGVVRSADVFLTVTKCAELTGYKPGYIRQLVFKRAIPFYKNKNLKPLRFKESEILSWMAERKFTPIDEQAANYLDDKNIFKLKK